MRRQGLGKNAKPLYFIAIIPPGPIHDDILSLKDYFKEKYQSKASLNSPPHITLHMPFEWREGKENTLISGLESFAARCTRFYLQLNGFNCFPSRVIYIHVVPSDKLTEMQMALTKYCRLEFNLFNANHGENPFHPHITIAFRDLKKGNFLRAWEEFKQRKFEASWNVESLVLLKHNGKRWNPLAEFPLSK